jgi:hypothetical protein
MEIDLTDALADSTLPPSIAHFQSLVPLVHNNQKNANLFGYSSWIYKAVSSQDGKSYCLRRLQGLYSVFGLDLSSRLIFYRSRLSIDE